MGAAQGIGFATAQLFAGQGAQVVVVDLLEESDVKAAETIGHGAYFLKCGVSSWEEMVKLFQAVLIKHERIAIAVLNAGIDPELAVMQSDKAAGKKAVQLIRCNWLAEERQADGGLKRPPSTIFNVNLDSVIFGIKLA